MLGKNSRRMASKLYLMKKFDERDGRVALTDLRFWVKFKVNSRSMNEDFTGMRFKDVDFLNCDFKNLDATGCEFINCKFYECVVTNMSVYEARLTNTRFDDCVGFFTINHLDDAVGVNVGELKSWIDMRTIKQAELIKALEADIQYLKTSGHQFDYGASKRNIDKYYVKYLKQLNKNLICKRTLNDK